MSLIYGVNGWLEFDLGDEKRVIEEIDRLLKVHAGVREWEVCLLPWIQSKRTPFGGGYSLLFAAGISYRYIPRFKELIYHFCALGVDIDGFFYLNGESMVHMYIKIDRSRIEIVDPAPPLDFVKTTDENTKFVEP